MSTLHYKFDIDFKNNLKKMCDDNIVTLSNCSMWTGLEIDIKYIFLSINTIISAKNDCFIWFITKQS